MRNRLLVTTGLAALVLGLGVNTASASFTGWLLHPGHTTPSANPNQAFSQRLPVPFHDDITSDQHPERVKLTVAQQHQALVWGLTPAEETRYVLLMQNRSGFFDQGAGHHFTPVEVLGANARTDVERAHYAEQDAKQQFAYLAKTLAYNAAYQHAAHAYQVQLHLPMVRPFDTRPFSPYRYQPVTVKPHDQYWLLVRADDAVKPIVAYFLAALRALPSAQLNVVFEGQTTNLQVQQWARGQAIPIDMVNTHQVTLNFDHGQFSRFHVTQRLPVLVQVRNGHSTLIDTGRF